MRKVERACGLRETGYQGAQLTPVYKGVFWLIDEELLTFPFDGRFPEGTAKSGDTYNHRKLWDTVRPKGCRKPFDYYPRGRVELSRKGKAIIYMSTHIGQNYLSDIRSSFELTGEVIVKYDSSRHYHCYLDSLNRG